MEHGAAAAAHSWPFGHYAPPASSSRLERLQERSNGMYCRRPPVAQPISRWKLCRGPAVRPTDVVIETEPVELADTLGTRDNDLEGDQPIIEVLARTTETSTPSSPKS